MYIHIYKVVVLWCYFVCDGAAHHVSFKCCCEALFILHFQLWSDSLFCVRCDCQPPAEHRSASAKARSFSLPAAVALKQTNEKKQKKTVNCRFRFNRVLTMLGQAQGNVLWKEAMTDAVWLWGGCCSLHALTTCETRLIRDLPVWWKKLDLVNVTGVVRWQFSAAPAANLS